MHPTEFSCVVTSIQAPTASMQRLSSALTEHGGRLIVVGDRKGPAAFDMPGCTFLSLAEQADLAFISVQCTLENSYARKNLGYLLAMSQGAAAIYETDDDTAPTASWQPRTSLADARDVDVPGWFNVFAQFTDQGAWPRGYPLQHIKDPVPTVPDVQRPAVTSIQTSLIDGEPDVDAIWRLTRADQVTYSDGPSLRLAPGTWCPFNSQATWWWPKAYPLMYLPMHCSFRMVDIWRSFVAQRCLWAMGEGVVHHAADVFQERNPHTLIRDFESEVSGYLHNVEIAACLGKLDLSPDPAAVTDNLVRCYDELVDGDFVGAGERDAVRAWRRDVLDLGLPARTP